MIINRTRPGVALFALGLLPWLTSLAAETTPPAPAAVDIRVTMRRVFDWQTSNLWSTQHAVDHRWGLRGWVHGAFLTGVMEAWRATGDTAYVDYAWATAEHNSWQPGPRPEHADDYVVGQTYVELHALDHTRADLGPLRARVDELVAKPLEGRKLWWWCDALYMAPPTLAKLAAATGEAGYLTRMDEWFWDSHASLYDPAERLFYRDERFFNPADGHKVFWSRGNGWVLAGLARLLDALPADHATRPRYEALFRDMAARVVEIQPADGLWRANLLYPESKHGEASGSAFFCYALAWGINQGLLPADSFRPHVDRTWAALLACVAEDGRLGWVQPIGSAPDAYAEETWQEYGSGAFLAAGAEMLKLR